MRGSLVAKRYARALFNLLGEQHLEKTCAQLNEMSELFDNDSIGKVLCSPVVSLDLKKTVLKSACEQLGTDKSFSDFIFSIVEAGRVAFIPKIAGSFQELSDEKRNIVRTTLSTAVALDDASVKDLTKILNDKLGKEIAAETKVDPSILGGLVVEIGNTKLDLSLKTRIENLAQSALS